MGDVFADLVGERGKSPGGGAVSPPGGSGLFSPIANAEETRQQNLLDMLHSAKVNVQPLLANAYNAQPSQFRMQQQQQQQQQHLNGE